MIGPVFAGIVGAVLVALLPTRDERARWRANRTTIASAPQRFRPLSAPLFTQQKETR